MQTAYGDISPRTAVHAARKFLEVGQPYVVWEYLAQSTPLPKNESDTVEWREYEVLDPTPKTLGEGVTPSATQLNHRDVTATLTQYGDGIQLSDQVEDFHEDPVLDIGIKRLGQQGAEMAELIRTGSYEGGTNVWYANGTDRDDVNTTLTRDLQRKITRFLERNRAKKISEVVKSEARYGTQNIPRAYFGVVHPDLDSVVRDMPGFKDVVDYGSISPFPNEIGSVEGVRYLKTDLINIWRDAGGDYDGSGTNMITESGTKADVYPVYYVGADALGTVALKGHEVKNNNGKMEPVVPVKIMVTNAKPSDSDPWAQRTWATYKFYLAAAILQDLWFVRAEVAVPE